MNPEERFNKEYEHRLRSLDFKCAPSGLWYLQAANALKFASTLSLGIDGSQFKDLVKYLHNLKLFNCYDFALLNNNLEARTPNDLGLTLHVYADLMIEAGGYAKLWREQTIQMREDLMAEIMQDETTKNKVANGKMINLLKGEA